MPLAGDGSATVLNDELSFDLLGKDDPLASARFVEDDGRAGGARTGCSGTQFG